PLGLLYIASFLRNIGYDISFIDCLDKYCGDNTGVKLKKYGTGHFNREIIAKPEILSHIPRPYARYGISEDHFIDRLKEQRNAGAILVTSLMTYWYPGVKRVVEICRQYLPGIPVVLGGIYASLMPGHARKVIKPDFLVEGPGELKVLDILNRIPGLDKADINRPNNLDDYPYPAFDLINHPDYLIIMTARGCPYNCTFCAQKLIAMRFTQRDPDKVVEEFRFHFNEYGIADFAFYDDALFIGKARHINVILDKLIESNLPLRLHSPNGLFANSIDAHLADLMYRSNFKTIRLSFETSNENRRKDMYSKVSNAGMIRAVEHLKAAGFNTADLEAYVLMGLPDQTLEEVLASIVFVNSLGVKVRLASFSPIPGTVEYDRAVESGFIRKNIDPLLTNNSIFPLNGGQINFELYQKIKALTNRLNRSAQEKSLPFLKESPEKAVVSLMGEIYD
ncbi:MAG: cobalamin-dependent protein, partial [Calditrichaceae bacterium]